MTNVSLQIRFFLLLYAEVCKKCDIDLNKRAGELTTDEVNKIVAVVSKPLEFKIPAWMLNRNRDVKDGKTSQKYANFLDQALREASRLFEAVLRL